MRKAVRRSVELRNASRTKSRLPTHGPPGRRLQGASGSAPTEGSRSAAAGTPALRLPRPRPVMHPMFEGRAAQFDGAVRDRTEALRDADRGMVFRADEARGAGQ